MNETVVLVKTDKGREEIANRSNQLGFKHRAGLIQTDGKKTAGQVLALVPGGSLALMQELIDGGYVAPLAGAAPTATAASDAPATPVAAAAATDATAGVVDLATRKRVAVRTISDILGPNGDMLAIPVERAKTEEDYAAAIAKAADIIGKIAGLDKARMFTKKIS